MYRVPQSLIRYLLHNIGYGRYLKPSFQVNANEQETYHKSIIILIKQKQRFAPLYGLTVSQEALGLPK